MFGNELMIAKNFDNFGPIRVINIATIISFEEREQRNMQMDTIV